VLISVYELIRIFIINSFHTVNEKLFDWLVTLIYRKTSAKIDVFRS